jgi:hypothetical protein
MLASKNVAAVLGRTVPADAQVHMQVLQAATTRVQRGDLAIKGGKPGPITRRRGLQAGVACSLA